MMRKLVPLLLGLAGLAGGVGAGIALRPDAKVADDHSAEPENGHEEAAHGEAPESDTATQEYVKLSNQFVIPVVAEEKVVSLVVIALSLEVAPGMTQTVYDREPKLRDAFLQVMFDHANVGGFNGSFTEGTNLLVLRTSLKEAAALILGPAVRDVLITDIARQDG